MPVTEVSIELLDLQKQKTLSETQEDTNVCSLHAERNIIEVNEDSFKMLYTQVGDH